MAFSELLDQVDAATDQPYKPPEGQGVKRPQSAGTIDIKATTDALEAKLKPQVERMREIDVREKDAASSMIKQGDALLERMTSLKAPEAPKMEKLPDAPHRQYSDPMQALGSMGTILAVIGSMKTRAPLTAALNSAAAAMQGFHKGDQEAMKVERENWNDNLTKALQQNQEELVKYQAALHSANFDLTKASSQWRVIAAQTENQAMLAAIESRDPTRMYQLYTDSAKIGNEMLKMQTAHLDREATLRMHQENIAEQRKDRQAMHADAQKQLVTGPDGQIYSVDKRTAPPLPTELQKGATKFGAAGSGGSAAAVPEEWRELHGEQLLDKLPAGKRGVVKAISEGRESFTSLGYRGKERAEMAQLVNQYNPNFQQGLQPARAGVIKDFTSGPQSKNIIAINQAISHMGTLDELGEALKNKDVRLINKFTNAIATEIGDPRINNFQLATQAVGDELMRTFRQVGASENEALAFQKKFQEAGSPEQIHGALETGAALLNGRIKAVNNSWKRGMDTEEDYPKLIDPEPKEVLKKFGINYVGGGEPKRRATDTKPDAGGWTSDDETRLRELEAKHGAQ